VLHHLDRESTLTARNLPDFGKGEQFYIVMPADLDQFR
jgi:hypothetical protein